MGILGTWKVFEVFKAQTIDEIKYYPEQKQPNLVS